MKRRNLERAAAVALDLADELARRLPECCAVPAEDLVPATWDLALRLTRLEVRARKDRKQAKRYRRAVRQARREIEVLFASQDGSAAAASALMHSVPFSPDMWRVALVPGAPAPDLSAEAEAA